MQEKLNLEQVSLICVETRHFELAHFALSKCMEKANFKEVVLLSSTPAPFKPGIDNQIIPPIRSTEEYSEFMIRDFGNYFSGSFALLVQWDSFILNVEAWSEDFLRYDYVGAPWPHREHPVGNGGFSLRSKRLIESLNKINITRTHPEDECICGQYRADLESQHNIVFAPVPIAEVFAFELTTPAFPTFGFHGFFNFHKALSEAEILQYIPMCSDNILRSLPARRLIKNLYRSRMFKAANFLIMKRMKHAPWNIKLDAFKLLLISLVHRILK